MKHRFLLLASICLTVCASSALAQTPAVLICRAKQCAEASKTMSKEYLFNQMSALLDKNIGSNVLLCEANPQTHVCLEKGISFQTQSSLIKAIVNIPSARIVDAKPLTKETGIDMILDYKVIASGTYPRCQTALSRLGVASADNVQMMSPSFACRLTETGDTVFSLVYNIDYIDFDYGTFGAYYSAASGLALPGGKNGYMLMRFTQPGSLTLNDAFPMNAIANEATGETQTSNKAKNQENGSNELPPIWMKPTPFLNMETPVFMSEDCAETGCSAQELNAVATNTPQLAGSVSTTGLIEQTREEIAPVTAARKVVLTTKQVIENGQTKTLEEKVQHFVKESPDGPFVEQKDKTQIKTNAQATPEMTILSQQAQMVAQQQAQAIAQQQAQAIAQQQAQAIAQQQAPQVMQPASQQEIKTAVVPTNTQPTSDPQLVIPNHTIPTEQLLTPQQLPEGITPEVYQQAIQKAQNTNVQIVMPQGIALTDQEQVYIQQMPLPQGALPAGYVPQQVAPQQMMQPQPVMATQEVPFESVKDVPQQQEPSFWDKLEKFFYF